MKSYLTSAFIIICLLSAGAVLAQNTMIRNGSIVFEKKVDVYSFLDTVGAIKGIGHIRERYERTNPQFKSTFFTLYFDAGRTLYEPSQQEAGSENEILDFIGQMASANIVYTDLTTHESVGLKSVMGNQFLIKDSVRRIHWKLKSDTRNIAGFHCRRADAVIMDSLYVIAFFCDQILPQGGPESLTGLPGMILGAALPKRNITWFATKLLTGQSNSTPIVPPVKEAPINNDEFRKSLEKSLKDNPMRRIILENSLL